MKSSSGNLSNELKKRGIRPSYQRIKVLEHLMHNQCHPTVDQIFNGIKSNISALSKSTIYNTLNLFIKTNLVRVINIEDNETRYDIIIKNHGHFKCDSCGHIYDFSINIDELITEELNNFIINDKNVYFKGICPKCL